MQGKKNTFPIKINPSSEQYVQTILPSEIQNIKALYLPYFPDKKITAGRNFSISINHKKGRLKSILSFSDDLSTDYINTKSN